MTERKSWVDIPQHIKQPALPGFSLFVRMQISTLPNPQPNSKEYHIVNNPPDGQSRIFSVETLEESRSHSNWNWHTKQLKTDCPSCPFHLEYEKEINGKRVFYETCELGVATKLLLEPKKAQRRCDLIHNQWKWFEGLRYQNIMNSKKMEFTVI